ncbi:armadillo-type protein [Pseudomassariella vexata]|uniref:Armadillo-type protein n=1 Tax=Pseudomassariella vexata TaxID=1141098 RepID=A0A1Y2DLY6_9PEZI|nr:armadillo-type protein [Pseudomassariella vexata]ORY60231.1 armadillo-type protein [Pseudomassariella vexata]
MPATSSGRIVKSRKGPIQKGRNQHKWQSFSSKISRLSAIDPLRKVRRNDLDVEDDKATTSYFRTGLEKWTDLNIAKGFTYFRREVLPISDSLAQILHFEDKIMDLLEKYVSGQEKESLEPLLELLTAFAHDLGTRFEKHYARALALIVETAGKRHDADVIEWTFASLAFLFKYLSRLLAPDIRPTYDAMAGLLGKARCPTHIARFAAESLSFLIKKAAAPSNRDKSLPLIIEHARADLQNTRGHRQHELYYHGLMTMFAEAIKGQGMGVHTVGPSIFKALVASIPNEECHSEQNDRWSDLVCGVLVSIIHHTNAEGFEPIAQSIYEQRSADESRKDFPIRNIMYVRLLGIMAGVRKASRISDWAAVLECLRESVADLCKEPSELDVVGQSSIWQHVLVNVAIILQWAPMDAIIPNITGIINNLTREPLMKWFIPFCSYFSDLDITKFRSLFLNHFQKFIMKHWSEDANEDMLCVLIPRMVQSRALPSTNDTEKFGLPQSWQDQIVAKFERLEVSPFPEEGASNAYDKDPKVWRDRCLPKYCALLQLLECTTVHPSINGPISGLLLRKLKLALRPSLSLATDEARFIVSQGFSAYLRMSQAAGQLDKSLSPLLRAAAPRYCRLTGFLKAMLAYEEQNDSSSPSSQDGSASPDKEEDPLLQCLIDNLSAESSELRLASLKLLDKLDIAPDQLEVLGIMLQIEQTPLDLQNVRAISSHIRKLSVTYCQVDENSWLRRAVPAFLFGLMTVRLAPVWESAVEAWKEVTQAKSGEEQLCERALQWLDVPSKRWDGPTNHAVGQKRQGLTDFECLNLMYLRRKADDAKCVIDDAADMMLSSFEDSQRAVPETPSNARSQALKILSAVPHLAEKRSRTLVPMFLSWSSGVEEQQGSSEGEEEADANISGSWSLFDKKGLLGVFAQFSNPRVLFQSQKVYDALLRLLANGDAEIQRAALKAIIAWKQDGVKPYQENLEYLLDEARFKNELTVLFQGDHQILPEHRDEIMPVLLRLLYGRTISKKGVASGRGGLQSTRLAVLRHLSVDDMGRFLDIALGELHGIEILQDSVIRDDMLDREIMPIRKQVGFLNMMAAMINELGTSVSAYANTLLNAVLYCLVFACRNLGQSAEDVDETESVSQTSLLRTVRTTAIKCVISLLRNAPQFDWAQYKDIVIKEVVSPRVDNLPAENTQGISGTFQLLSVLSLTSETALFLALDGRIVVKLLDCLSFQKAKDEVRVFALSIIRNLIKDAQAPAAESESHELIKTQLIDPNLDMILRIVGGVLKSDHDIGKDLLAACVDAVVELSPIVQQSGNTAELIDISVYLLNQPSRRVNPKVKGNVLTILEKFLRLENLKSDAPLRERIYSTIASLFGYFKDTSSRQALSRVLTVYAGDDAAILKVASLCTDLNSYVERRMDEPNYERRLAAFNEISKREIPFTPHEWEPLLHNMLFYIKHDEEYGILSSNSADGMCKFVEAAAASTDEENDAYQKLLADSILPAIYAGAREPSETVRRETVRVLGFLVSHLPSWAPVSDLVGLDPPPDEQDSDPSFFSHILSPATSRQMRALQLLSKVNYHAELSSKNLAHFFIPLLEHFIFSREEGNDDHGVGAQATTAIADLAVSLEWPQFRATIRRYIGYIETRPEAQKQLVRLLGKIIDSLAVAALEKYEDNMEIDEASTTQSKKHRLASTMPAAEKFSDDIVSNVLPPLMEYIHDKDETTVSSRVPVGIILVKLLKLLPPKLLEQKLPGVLTDMCHILRSKSWESREMARDTLAKMTTLLGPSYFGFVLDELRGALTKGYQLHVLSYTMHSILVHGIPLFQPGDLDYCLDKIVAVIMDDIFGVVGQEKDAEEYTSQMKEVKSSKSQDSMELVARTTSIGCLVELVRPMQSLLLEKLDLRMVRKIDELLTRIANGLLANPAAESQDTLVFCYEVIQRVYESDKPRAEVQLDYKLRRYLVQKGAKRSGERGSTSKHTYKLIRFAFDILRAVWKKHDSIRTAGNISGFVPILGDAIVGGEEEVKVAAFKLLTVIVRVPFKTEESTKLYKVAVKEATKSIAMSTSTSTDLAQAALKLLSVALRDHKDATGRRDVVLKDTATDLLLGNLKDDLTEPLYRHVTFNFLRSILDSKLETASVYDTLDYVGTVMITNDDKDTRDLARGAFFQFLRDYPQKKNRWAKQLAFIVANLKYDREGGRLSVMEAINLLLNKSANDFVQEIATTCFIPLIFVLANDDSEKCRLVAGGLLKEIFRRSDKERTSKFLTLLRNWLEQGENQSVLRLGIQGFGFYFEAKVAAQKDQKDLDLLVARLVEVLDDYASFADDWELINTIVQTVCILGQKFPSVILAHAELWHAIARPLTSTHPVVKLSAVGLLNLYLNDFYEQSQNLRKEKKNKGMAEADESLKELTGSYGLLLEKSAAEALVVLAVGILSPAVVARWRKRMAKKNQGDVNITLADPSTSQSQSTDIDENLATAVVHSLKVLGTFLDQKPSASDNESSDEAPVDEDEEEDEGGSADDDEWTGIEEPSEPVVTLHTLFTLLSDILIAETTARSPALVPKTKAMDLLTHFIHTLPSSTLLPSLNILLTPLHHLTDPSIPMPVSVDDEFKARYEELKTQSQERMDMLQRKMGTEAYTREVLKIREMRRKRREGRARKRKIEAVAAPEKYGKWKRGKLDKKIKARKVKGVRNRERRHGAGF